MIIINEIILLQIILKIMINVLKMVIMIIIALLIIIKIITTIIDNVENAPTSPSPTFTTPYPPPIIAIRTFIKSSRADNFCIKAAQQNYGRIRGIRTCERVGDGKVAVDSHCQQRLRKGNGKIPNSWTQCYSSPAPSPKTSRSRSEKIVLHARIISYEIIFNFHEKGGGGGTTMTTITTTATKTHYSPIPYLAFR